MLFYNLLKLLYSSNTLFLAECVFEAGLLIEHGVDDDQAGIYLINFFI